jgi:hypothetical protein
MKNAPNSSPETLTDADLEEARGGSAIAEVVQAVAGYQWLSIMPMVPFTVSPAFGVAAVAAAETKPAK